RSKSMRGQPGFFDFDDRLKLLSDLGDQLESFRSAVDFELFRPELSAALSYADRTEGGRPPFDPVLMFKILVIHRHVGSTRRCHPGWGGAAAQYGRREEGDQRGPDTGELEGQAGQAAAQGSRRTLDGQIQQAKPREDGSMPPVDNPAIWLSEPC